MPRRAGRGAQWGPTTLEDKYDWERPFIHERWQGDLVERTAAMGARSKEREKHMQYKLRPVDSETQWRKAHSMGVELFELANKFREVNYPPPSSKEPTYATDPDWKTYEWSDEEVVLAFNTLVDVFFASPLESQIPKREMCVHLMGVLFERHRDIIRATMEVLVDDLLERGLRVPDHQLEPPERLPLHLLALLVPYMADKYVRALAMNRAVTCLSYEYFLSARRIQTAWRVYRFRAILYEKMGVRHRSRTAVELQLKSGMLRDLWSWMTRSHSGSIMRARLAQHIHLFMAAMIDPEAAGRRKNVERLEEMGGLVVTVLNVTHMHRGVREQAAAVIRNLAQLDWFRPTLVIHGLTDSLLTMLWAQGTPWRTIVEESFLDAAPVGGDGEPGAEDAAAGAVAAPGTGSEAGAGAAAAPGSTPDDAVASAPPPVDPDDDPDAAAGLWFLELCREDRLRALEIADLMSSGDGVAEALKVPQPAATASGSAGAEGWEPPPPPSPDDGMPLDKFGRPDATKKPRRKLESWQVGHDSEDSEEDEWDVEAEEDLRALVGTGEGWGGADKPYEVVVSILKNRAIVKDNRTFARTETHGRILKRVMYLQSVAEEQGEATVREPPAEADYDRYLVLDPMKRKTTPYTVAIKQSEAVLNVDAVGYWSLLGEKQVAHRLVQLLSASDSETRLGACMVLTKLVSADLPEGMPPDALMDTIAKCATSSSSCFKSLVGTLDREEPVVSTSAMVFMRHLMGHESNRRSMLRAGVKEMLIRLCANASADSLKFVLGLHVLVAFAFPSAQGPEDDAEPIDLAASPAELGDQLARTLLTLVMDSDDRVEASIQAMVLLDAVPQFVRFLCGGVDFAALAEEAPEFEEGGGGEDEGDELSVISDVGGEAEEEDEGETDEGETDEEGADVGDADTTPRDALEDDAGDDGASEDLPSDTEAEDGDVDEDEEEEWARRTERRYISAVVLEKMAEHEDALPDLCVARVLAHLIAVLHENRIQKEAGDATHDAGEPTLDPADAEMLRVSSQAACRTLTTMARSKVLPDTTRGAVSQAVLGMGTVRNLVPMFSREWQDATNRQLLRARTDTYEARNAAKAADQAAEDAYSAPPEGSTKDQARLIKAAQAAAVEANKALEAAEEGYNRSKRRKRDDEETVEAAIVLLANIVPQLSELDSDEADRLIGPGDTDGAGGDGVPNLEALLPEMAPQGTIVEAASPVPHSVGPRASVESTPSSPQQPPVSPVELSRPLPDAAVKPEPVRDVVDKEGGGGDVVDKGVDLVRKAASVEAEGTLDSAGAGASAVDHLGPWSTTASARDGQPGPPASAGERVAPLTARSELSQELDDVGVTRKLKYNVRRPAVADDSLDPSVEAAIVHVTPTLMDLIARTPNNSIRTSGLFALSRFAYSPASARLLLRLGALDLVLAFFPTAVRPRNPGVPADHPMAGGGDGRPTEFTIAPTRLNAGDAHPTGKDETSIEPIPANRVSGTLLTRLPVTVFTLIGALCRMRDCVPDVCASGLLSACVDRFAVDTGRPAVDTKAKGEIAMVLARITGSTPAGYGPVNDVILGKTATRLPEPLPVDVRGVGVEATAVHTDASPSGNFNVVASGLVKLLAASVSKRAQYAALVCLANLAQDVFVAIPTLLSEGVLGAIRRYLADPSTPSLTLRHAIRITSCIAICPLENYKMQLLTTHCIHYLRRIGVDVEREEVEKEAGLTITCKRLAATAIENIGEEYVRRAENMRVNPHEVPTLVPAEVDEATGEPRVKPPPSPMRTAPSPVLKPVQPYRKPPTRDPMRRPSGSGMAAALAAQASRDARSGAMPPLEPSPRLAGLESSRSTVPAAPFVLREPSPRSDTRPSARSPLPYNPSEASKSTLLSPESSRTRHHQTLWGDIEAKPATLRPTRSAGSIGQTAAAIQASYGFLIDPTFGLEGSPAVSALNPRNVSSRFGRRKPPTGQRRWGL